jgi:Uma2 family endonuclease
MPDTLTHMTAAQFLALPEDVEGARPELVNEELRLSPSSNRDHSWTVLALASAIRPFILTNKLGRLYTEFDTQFDALNVRRPDLMFFVIGRLKDVKLGFAAAPPDLCIEVLSPGNIKYDRRNKFDLYQRAGVGHYWIVNPMARSIEAYALEAGAYALAAQGRGDPIVRLPPFAALEIPLADLWHPED